MLKTLYRTVGFKTLSVFGHLIKTRLHQQGKVARRAFVQKDSKKSGPVQI